MSGRKRRSTGAGRAFGRLLVELRQGIGRRNSLEVVVEMLAERGHSIAKSTISRYENKGRAPEVHHLAALAEIYKTDRHALADALLAAVRDKNVTIDQLRDLLRHGFVVQDGLPQIQGGPPNVPEAQARIRELEDRIEQFHDAIAVVRARSAASIADIDALVGLSPDTEDENRRTPKSGPGKTSRRNS